MGTRGAHSASAGRHAHWLSLFLLSAATLAFEIDLTRLFSVAQFYHFAFMIVSIALLGFGASGTALAVFPALRRGDPVNRLSMLALAAGLSTLGAYLLTNWLPFDSFSIAWDRRQLWILLLHYILLAAPFFCTGLALGFLISRSPATAGRIYAANLFGSAAGCLVALALPAAVGAEGIVTISVALTALAAIIPLVSGTAISRAALITAVALLSLACAEIGLRLAGTYSLNLLALRISPYKSLSYALQYPGSRILQTTWNAFSRVDVVRSAGIHSVPGLSYRYLEPLPALDALFVDGDNLSPIARTSVRASLTAHLPAAAAFHLEPSGDALVLEPRGGLDLLTALRKSSGTVTAVESNPLIIDLVPLFADPQVRVRAETDRSYLLRSRDQYDVIVISLAESFRPVRSGAYSLAEDYRYTAESFQAAAATLKPGGLLVATRWLQDPPSEDLRLFALAVETAEKSGGSPQARIVAFRGFNTATVLLKNGDFTLAELSALRTFLAARAFDLTYAPDIRPDETNRYNVLPRSVYYETYLALINSNPHDEFYARYEYDVRPPTDDRPFFGHYFKWTQARRVLGELGTAWLPFGGAGYFVILALLVLAVLLATVLILLPVALRRLGNARGRGRIPVSELFYFGLLGLAFMFIELPLVQHFILYLGQPAYSVAAVLFALLLFSGIGSRLNQHIGLIWDLLLLAILLLALPYALQQLFALSLGLPLAVRLGITGLALAPVGFLMGVPFPAGIRLLASSRETAPLPVDDEGSVPWAWAVNGASSVVGSILAALLALTFGFSWVLRLGAVCYALAVVTAYVWIVRSRPLARPR
ncbi:MAG: hypothetical protein ACK2T0_02375 [Anaerolineales bacterium]